jgi:hypothetical protein
MSTTINIIQDAQLRVTVSQLDPTIHFQTDAVVIWQNTLTSAVDWSFPGAPSLFVENQVNVTIPAGGSLTRNIDQNTGVRGQQGYTVGLAAMAATVGGSQYQGPPAQPTPGLDIEP